MRAMEEESVRMLHHDDGIRGGLSFLQIVHQANKNLGEPILYSEFYNDPVNERMAEQDQMVENFVLWRRNQVKREQEFVFAHLFKVALTLLPRFSVCSFCFALNPLVKSRMLDFDFRFQQMEQGVGI